MNKSFLFFLLGSVFCLTVNAQTKRIFHRSHSGSNEKFSVSAHGNFGEYKPVMPDKTKRTPVKKLRVIKSDSTKAKSKKDVPLNKQEATPKKTATLVQDKRNAEVK